MRHSATHFAALAVCLAAAGACVARVLRPLTSLVVGLDAARFDVLGIDLIHNQVSAPGATAFHPHVE